MLPKGEFFFFFVVVVAVVFFPLRPLFEGEAKLIVVSPKSVPIPLNKNFAAEVELVLIKQSSY